MVTARSLAEVLTPAVVTVLHAGADRPVADLEIVEPGLPTPAEPTDLTLAVGTADSEQLLALVPAVAHTAGLVVRRELASTAVVATSREAGLTLLGLAPGTGWSAVVSLLRSGVEHGGSESADDYGGLFVLADRLSAVLGAPVTIEDPQSRVLAYSTGQHDVDAARLSSIVGRRVPAEVREHFRSLGVFRRLVRSDEPVFVRAGPEGIKPRYVVPVRAGGEWLGSVWAVVDGPVDDARAAEMLTVTRTLALHLLRLRGQTELDHVLHAEQVRSLLREAAPSRPAFLPDGPWRAVALHGPGERSNDAARRALWTALARRHGWRRPLLTDLADVTYAIVTDVEDDSPGTWPWLRSMIEAETARDPSLWATAGAPVASVGGLPTSAAQAAEQLALGREALPGPATTAEECWAVVTLARAARSVDGQRPGPVAALRDHDERHRTAYVETLAAVLDHWGHQKAAARQLGVHPNSIRLRMARVRELLGADLEDPRVRLALQVQLL